MFKALLRKKIGKDGKGGLEKAFKYRGPFKKAFRKDRKALRQKSPTIPTIVPNVFL